jgi:hypothetical protein
MVADPQADRGLLTEPPQPAERSTWAMRTAMPAVEPAAVE